MSTFGVGRDFHQGARQLARSPLWTSMLILVLGSAMGLALTVFALVDLVLFRPLPISDQARVVTMAKVDGDDGFRNNMSYLAYAYFREHSQSFSAVAATGFKRTLHWRLSDGQYERVDSLGVSGNWFSTLGVSAAHGRVLIDADDQPDAASVAVLSHHFWRNRLGGDASVVGSTIELNGEPTLVVGVAAEGFDDLDLARPPDMWQSLHVSAPGDEWLREWPYQWVNPVARLGEGVTFDSAAAEVQTLASAIALQADKSAPHERLDMFPVFPRFSPGSARNNAWLLLMAACAIVLIGCANAAGLLGVRRAARRADTALRRSLGCTYGRLLRAEVVELAVVVALSGVAAMWLADLMIGVALSAGDAQAGLGVVAGCETDGGRRAFALIPIAIVVLGVLSVLLLIDTRRQRVPVDLGRSRVMLASGAGHARWLLMAQIAVTVALLAGTGLLLASITHLRNQPLGFQPSDALVMDLDYHSSDRRGERADHLNTQLLAGLAGVQGIKAAAVATIVPMTGRTASTMVQRYDGPGQDASEGLIGALYNPVSGPYFQALGLSVIEGRVRFDAHDHDGEDGVAISESLSNTLWPGQSSIGQSLVIDPRSGERAKVLAVVADARFVDLQGGREASVYVSSRRRHFADPTQLIVRAEAGQVDAARHAIAHAWRSVQPTRAVPPIRALDDVVANTLAVPRFLAGVLGAFATLATILACIGIYGVLTYSVGLRTREVGLRMAIGSTRGGIIGLILRDTGRLLVPGLLAGGLLALAFGQMLSHRLFGVTAYDLGNLVASSLLLAVAGLLAAFFPALRAASIDPQQALRGE